MDIEFNSFAKRFDMNIIKSQSRFKNLKRTSRYLKPYISIEIGIAFLMLLVVGFSMIDPLVMKIMIDDIFIDKNFYLLNIIIVAMIILFIMRSGIRIITNYLIQYVGQKILFNIRMDLFQHLEHLHIGFFTKTKTGEIITRVNNDVSRVQDVLTTTLISLITDIVSVLVIFIIMIILNWKLTLVSSTIFPFLFISQYYMGRKIKKKSREVRDKSAEIVSFFQEVFTSIKLIQSFAAEKFEAIRLLRENKELINLRITLGVIGGIAAAIAGFLSTLGPVVVLWFGGRQVMEGTLSLGSLVAFYAYVGRLFRPILRLAQYNVAIQTARASIDRIFEFFDIEPKIVDEPGSIWLEKIKGDIEFENVSFYYDPKEKVLNNISFLIKSGQKVAIVGPSGVGKSTIVDLLERFYDPISGRILIDGYDIKRIKLKSLRKHIGVVSQNTILFNTTIKENIMYGKKKASDEEIINAARKADIHDFISCLPNGYETIVGERGLRLSGGQCQRISIARTILKDPEILILDEAMSSLDTKSESLIHRALKPLMEKKTTIIVAHRLTSITDADIIYVLYGGKFVESGVHEELMNKSGIYRMLWDQMTQSTNDFTGKKDQRTLNS